MNSDQIFVLAVLATLADHPQHGRQLDQREIFLIYGIYVSVVSELMNFAEKAFKSRW